MELPSSRLPRDVLLELLYHIPQQSVISSLMRTSKDLLKLGEKELVGRGVTLESDAQVRSFCGFIRRDPPSRAVHLRKLSLEFRYDPEIDADDDDFSLGPPPPSKATCKLLLKVLRRAINLEHLRIDSCEELLERQPQIQDAVAALKALRQLQLSSIGVLTDKMLKKMKSSLTSLDLRCYSEEIEVPDELLSMVGRHRETLEKLSGWYCGLGSFTQQYPRVRALALRAFYELGAAVIRQAFPNLQYLELTAPRELGEIEDVREENLQQTANPPWTPLWYLCGSVDALYALGALPRVKKLEVDYVSSRQECLTRLRGVVAESHPSQVVLQIGYYEWNAQFTVTATSELLPEESAPDITHLVLDMSVKALRGSSAELMSGLLALLRKSGITFLVFRIGEDVEPEVLAPSKAKMQGEEDEDDAPGSGDDEAWHIAFKEEQVKKAKANHKMETVLKAFGRPLQEGLVRDFAAAASSLKHVVLKIKGHGATYWEVERESTSDTLKELAPNVGEGLIRAEGLAPNDRSSGLEGIP
ncbi:hypothetical protein GY45DRAFT_1311290 [Cubamyces sp. BRFM 1775]|nr:hypothetical protein GY45DRAFT_1311290 [Cubamyces sp. BRFM 1775]